MIVNDYWIIGLFFLIGILIIYCLCIVVSSPYIKKSSQKKRTIKSKKHEQQLLLYQQINNNKKAVSILLCEKPLQKIQIDSTITNKQKYIAFCTCFYGTLENPAMIIKSPPSSQYDCYYITNNQDVLVRLQKTSWIGIYDDVPISNDAITSSMQAKKLKAVPESFACLQKYEYICYLDSKLDIDESVVLESIQQHPDVALIIKQHDFIPHSVQTEFQISMNQIRYYRQHEQYKKYIERQLKNGLKDVVEKHCETRLIIRKMHHPFTHSINVTWYQHIQECGIECQISFFFIQQLFANYIYIYPSNKVFVTQNK
uniref:Uncharacterized protein n=1 Tax=viral metagenome TaxID=1070528 RepID=A0A6C0CQX9_9ZZZZ